MGNPDATRKNLGQTVKRKPQNDQTGPFERPVPCHSAPKDDPGQCGIVLVGKNLIDNATKGKIEPSMYETF